MIFNEIYSAYYNAVAKIIAELLKGNRDEKSLEKIVTDSAFGESMLTVLPSLKSGKWQLVRKDMTTPVRSTPTMPLSLIQKRWLKAITLDPRIKLFGVEIGGLDDVEPLFTPDDYVIYDKYGDGDPYEDEKYVNNFRTVLEAIKSGKELHIEMENRKGGITYSRCIPKRLEYSEKDDKFRVITSGCRFITAVNVGRIISCRIHKGDDRIRDVSEKTVYKELTLKVSEQRNTLERCLLHFAHFEKRAEKAEGHYLLHLRYDKNDLSEMVIRVLSFGPTVEVLEPEGFKELIIDKLRKQNNLEL